MNELLMLHLYANITELVFVIKCSMMLQQGFGLFRIQGEECERNTVWVKIFGVIKVTSLLCHITEQWGA